jgi:hypothetical protein
MEGTINIIVEHNFTVVSIFTIIVITFLLLLDRYLHQDGYFDSSNQCLNFNPSNRLIYILPLQMFHYHFLFCNTEDGVLNPSNWHTTQNTWSIVGSFCIQLIKLMLI